MVKGQLMQWLRFVWGTLNQVEGFFPKLKAIGKLVIILKNR
jgi:hypothetical protein